MDTSLFIYTVVFMGLFLAFPRELKKAGFDIEYIFQLWLGDSQLDYLGYHVRRTSLTFLLHCCLPFLYLAIPSTTVVPVTIPELMVTWIATLGAVTGGYGMLCFLLQVCLQKHSVYRTIQKYEKQLSRIKLEVNSQVRSIGAYHTDNGAYRLTVTNDWLLAPSCYSLQAAYLDDTHLELESSTTLELSENAKEGSQFIKIIVTSTSGKFRQFTVILNSLDYRDFSNSLKIAVHNTRSIIVRQSLSEQFIDTFRAHVRDNPMFSLQRHGFTDADVENCLGCLVKKAEVKLFKTCRGRRAGSETCLQCRCRPMWCMECMARWFSSKQDQSTPTMWLRGKAPCPMCRQVFCMLDVSYIAV